MKHLNPTEAAAHRLQHPLNPIKYWQVVQNGKPVYENNSVALCQDYINQHALKGTRIKSKR